MSSQNDSSHPDNTDTTDPGGGEPEKKVTTSMLVFMAYVAVFGCGPYALEEVIGTGYPLWTFIGIGLVPWVNGLQCSLMTAELSSAIRHNGGYLMWVKMAFGSYWGFEVAAFALFGSLVDLALYPVLFCDYFSEYFLLSGVYRAIVTAIFISFCLFLGLIGVRSVGTASIIFTLLGLSPFLVMVVWGLPRLDPSSWIVPPPDLKLVNWGLWISLISWCVQGFDSLSTVAEDTQNPSQYSLAMILALLLIIVSSFLPIAIIVSVDHNYAQYTSGYFVIVAEKIGGPILRNLLICGALIGTVATFNIYLYTTSTYLSVLGGKEFIGLDWIQKKNRFGSPYLSMITLATVVFFLTFLKFGSLIQVDQAFYAVTLFLKYGSLIKLRFSHPQMVRPYAIPLSKWGLIFFVIPPILLCSTVILLTVTSSWITFGIITSYSSFILITPLLLYYICGMRLLGSPLKEDETMTEPSPPHVLSLWERVMSFFTNEISPKETVNEEIIEKEMLVEDWETNEKE